ncbi:MAG: ATP-binding protein [Nitriliruptoraceae bacterium]
MARPTDASRPLVCEFAGGAGALRPAARRVVTWIVGHGLDPARADRVELALHEVLANALEHGHGDDPQVPIVVTAGRSGSAVEVAITDRALAGRRPTPPADPHDAGWSDRLFEARGRGLVLAASAVDDLVVLRENDRTVVTLRLELG